MLPVCFYPYIHANRTPPNFPFFWKRFMSHTFLVCSLLHLIPLIKVLFHKIQCTIADTASVTATISSVRKDSRCFIDLVIIRHRFSCPQPALTFYMRGISYSNSWLRPCPRKGEKVEEPSRTCFGRFFLTLRIHLSQETLFSLPSVAYLLRESARDWLVLVDLQLIRLGREASVRAKKW